MAGEGRDALLCGLWLFATACAARWARAGGPWVTLDVGTEAAPAARCLGGAALLSALLRVLPASLFLLSFPLRVLGFVAEDDDEVLSRGDVRAGARRAPLAAAAALARAVRRMGTGGSTFGTATVSLTTCSLCPETSLERAPAPSALGGRTAAATCRGARSAGATTGTTLRVRDAPAAVGDAWGWLGCRVLPALTCRLLAASGCALTPALVAMRSVPLPPLACSSLPPADVLSRCG